jgi:endonuclease/exonuclease/phosphatase family metal-dependent hydrolase
MWKLRGFNRIVWWLNIPVSALLLGAYASLFVSPKTFYPFAFLGLAYPICLLLNTLFLLYWLVQFRIHAMLSLISILGGWPMLSRVIQVRPFSTEFSEKQAKAEHQLKFMTWNVRLFDLYNWSHNKETRKQIFDFLSKERPDVLAFQEFYASDDDHFVDVDSLKELLNLPYSQVHYTITLRKKNHWGLAIFSRYPIRNGGHVAFETRSNNACVYADVELPNRTVRVYNLHLQSIHFKKEDYDFIDSLKAEANVDRVASSRRILGRMKRGFQKRAQQVDLMSMHLASCPHPKILAGDFNDSPVSYTYERLSTGLKDAFLQSGTGLGQSYGGKFPSFRIDYILHDESLPSSGFTIYRNDLSDHYAQSCYFKVPGMSTKP